MRLRTRVSDADSTVGGSPTWYGRSNSGYRQQPAEQEESGDEGEVDLLVVGQQMGRVGQEDAAVDKALEQVRLIVLVMICHSKSALGPAPQVIPKKRRWNLMLGRLLD